MKLDHVGSKTRLLGHQATQVSDLGPLWPSCLCIYADLDNIHLYLFNNLIKNLSVITPFALCKYMVVKNIFKLF